MLCILMNKLLINIQSVKIKILNKDLFDLINKRTHKKPAVVFEIKLIKQQKKNHAEVEENVNVFLRLQINVPAASSVLFSYDKNNNRPRILLATNRFYSSYLFLLLATKLCNTGVTGLDLLARTW